MKYGRIIRRKAVDHDHLLAISPVRKTDYKDYGGEIARWADDDKDYPDCSGGCKWAVWLEHPFTNDWCVCTKPGGPREGLLTFEHQAGYDCAEGGIHYSDPRAAKDRAKKQEAFLKKYAIAMTKTDWPKKGNR